MHRGLLKDKEACQGIRHGNADSPDRMNRFQDKEADRTFLRHPRQLARQGRWESARNNTPRRTLRGDTSLTWFTQDVCSRCLIQRNFNARSYGFTTRNYKTDASCTLVNF